MKKLLFTLLLLIPIWNCVFAQGTWETWDARYPAVEYSKIIKMEKTYADSIEKLGIEEHNYVRKDGYKLNANYTGQFRPINNDVFDSMKRVCKLTLGNSVQLDGLVSKEVLVKIDDKDVWMPIQDGLIPPLKEEVKVGENIILYCLFLNEHLQNSTLFNTFFISEFRTK